MKFSNYNVILDENEDNILCNTMTGHIFKIDDRVKNLIQNNDIKNFSESEIALLTERGIITEDNIDEIRILEHENMKVNFSATGLSLTLLLTTSCNLNCTYCYQGAGNVHGNKLTDDIRSSIFKFIKRTVEEKNLKYVSIMLFGGEPLLYLKDNVYFLKEVQEFCMSTNRGFVTMIITNGVLINDDIINVLHDLNCKYIQITLDGVKEIHDERRLYKNGNGSFDEVISGIKKVLNSDKLANPLIRINIDKINYQRTFELIEYLAKENLLSCSIDFGIVRADSSANSTYTDFCFQNEELGDILEPLWEKVSSLKGDFFIRPVRRNSFCGMYSNTAFTISPIGEVYKCWELYDKEHIIGSLNKEGNLSTIQYSLSNWMSRSFRDNPECLLCQYLPMCSGGCGSVSYGKFGTYHKPGCFKTISVFNKQILWQYRTLQKLHNDNYQKQDINLSC